MAWWGKILGGTFGFMLGGPIGALLGASLGHQFDQGIRSVGSGASAAEKVQAAFFTATFSVMGHIAKADGKVSAAEISMAEDLMQQMRLDARQRTLAIDLFQKGKAPDFPLDEVLDQLRTECGLRTNLLRIFLELQIQAAWVDGRLDAAETRILAHIADRLGFPRGVLEELLQFSRYTQREPSAAKPKLADDYRLLGITSNASDAEVKKAYRRLMNRHHPDKLVSKGMPEEMIRIATEKTQQIRQAYDRIRHSRKC